jgi:hypothetical protein
VCGAKDRILKNLDEIYEKGILKEILHKRPQLAEGKSPQG